MRKKTIIASNVLILGLVSFFTDIGTQMIYPILPLYLTTVLGASPVIIGVIEGIAESFASILRIFSGVIADKYNNKKQLAFVGYFGSFASKAVILLANTWAWILFARIVDRLGKGLRTAPRDALIAEAAGGQGFGKAYGFHKAFDMLGTAIGILFAYFMLAAVTDNASGYRTIFMYAMIPAFIGPMFVLFVKNSPKPTGKKVEFRWKAFDVRLKLFFVIIFIFTLGNSSNAFLLLRANAVGFSVREAVMLYFVFSMTAALLSYPIGKLSDKIGRKYTLPFGYVLYGLIYFGIGLLDSRLAFWGLFVAYGLFIAINTGGERALIAEIAPKHLKASAFGLHAAVVGIGLLPASVIAGILWDAFGHASPFVFGGVLATFAGVTTFFLLDAKNTPDFSPQQ